MPYTLYPEGSPGSAFDLAHVTEDSASHEVEETVMRLIGKGRKVDRGTNWGRTRTLVCWLQPTGARTTAAQMAEIVALRTPGCDAIILDDPFGDQMKCSITSLSEGRVSAGQSDVKSVTITLEEVA